MIKQIKITKPRVRLAVLVATLLSSSIAIAQEKESATSLASFLDNVGGTTNVSKLRGESNPVKSYISRSLPRITGYRILKDKNKDPLETTNNSKALLERQCNALGGYLEPQDSANNQAANDHFSKIVDGYGYSGVWGYLVSTVVCSKDDETVIGGMGAIITDRTPFRRKHRGNPLLKIGLMKEPNITTVFALDDSMFVPIAERQRQDRKRADMVAGIKARNAAYEARTLSERIARNKKFRSELKIGMQTNCGMVIDIRQSLVEVQLPAGTSYDGQRQFWVAKTDLSDDPPVTNCSFGQ